MKTLGQQLLLDLWLAQGNDADAESHKISELIRTKFDVVKEFKHHFSPYGITWMFILSESHAAIHTYPEHHFLSIDVYVCNNAIRLDLFAKSILEAVACRDHNEVLFTRGKVPGNLDRPQIPMPGSRTIP